jgi:hypothetical protein
MEEARLQAELRVIETKVELQLKDKITAGTRTLLKDLSLIALIPKWNGADTGIPLEQFLPSIENISSLGLWQDSDKRQVAVLRLTDAAKQVL